MDQLDIVPGMLWDDEIQVAIDQSETMLVVLSPASIESKNVRDEVNFALDQDDDLVPVLHRQCEIPFRLRRIQHIDFTGDYDQAFERLINRLTGKPVEGSPKRVVRKRWALAPKYVGYYTAALVSVLVAGGLGWYYSTQPPSAPPSVDAGEDRTIVDVNDDAVERVSLDAGGTLSNGEPIALYEWYVDSQLVSTDRRLSAGLAPGLHRIELAAMDETGERFEDALSIKVITSREEANVRALLKFARNNIALAEQEFNTVYLTDGVSSAYAALQQVQEIDPFNVHARESLKRIADLLEGEARRALDNRETEQAKTLIEKGLKVDPEHSGLIALQAQSAG